MYIKKLHLINYRNYEELKLELNRNVNIFIGDNAQGKTNILESIYFCSLGKSHRTNRDKELINWNKDRAFVSLHISKIPLDKKIDISLLKDGKKGIVINNIKINKLSELLGVFNVVMFSPEDLKIVKDSPSFRRRFLDIELCKLSQKYFYSLVQYNKVLEERNTLLKNQNKGFLNMLDIYDNQLADFGEYIVKKRMQYIAKMNDFGMNIHQEITDGKEEVSFLYESCAVNSKDIKSALREELSKNRKKDIERRITSSGPHRDDFAIKINNIDTRNYGSQGQQRTVVLTIKFASLYIVKEEKGEFPVLLLDDVLSELDINRQRYILNSIVDVQTFITCTGIEGIKDHLKQDVSLFLVKNNQVERLE